MVFNTRTPYAIDETDRRVMWVLMVSLNGWVYFCIF